jgi:uncharacterized membrane protein YqjE
VPERSLSDWHSACIAERMVQRVLATESMTDLSTPELLRRALDDSKELVRLELRLAREELREDVQHMKGAAILLSIAAALFIVSLSMFDVAVVFALGGTVKAALIVAFIVLGEVAIVGFIGYRLLPKVPLERTRARLATDVQSIKEQAT